MEISYKKMANSRRILEAAGTAYGMTGGDGSATEQLGRALREVQSVAEYDPQLGELASQLEEIDDLLNDFNRELSGYISDGEFDEETFYEVEKRLDLVNHLKEKFGGSIDAVLKAKEEKEMRCQHLRDYEEYLEELKKRLSQSEEIGRAHV